MLRHLPQTLQILLRSLRPERGATATEYSLMVGFVSLIIIAGVGIFGLALNSLYDALATGIKMALSIP